MYKESADRLQGNDAYEGYGIDLIAEIAQILSKASSCLFRIRHQLSPLL
jgi:hypothetical protein